MKTLWSELELAGRALLIVLAMVVLATPIGVALLVGRTHAAGHDSPLDFVRAERRTAQALQTLEEATWVAVLETLWAMPAPTFVPDDLVTATPLPAADIPAVPRPTPTRRPTTAGNKASATRRPPAEETALAQSALTKTPIPPSAIDLGLVAPTHDSGPLDTLVAHYVELSDGVATLIQWKDLAILVDAGGAEDDVLLDYVLMQGIVHLDMAIVTRVDAAHTTAAGRLYPLLAPDVLWTPHQIASDEQEQALFDLVLETGGDHYTPAAGERYQYDGLLVECLYSSRDDPNADSLAVRLTYGEMGLLFTGDTAAEGALLDAQNGLRADALRLAYDGPDPAQGVDLLAATRPEFAIYTGPAPRDPFLNTLAATGVPVYATADYGTLRFVTDGWVYQLEAERVPTPAP
ncbi:MAG: hypothetical protein GX657_02375 [Chloroflexi bacterium]|nr:hypothetical protein [Chloroflexota bacterium]